MQPRELISLSQTRSRHSQLGLELSRKVPFPRLQLTEARDDSAKIPRRGPPSPAESLFTVTHQALAEMRNTTLVPRRIFNPRVCPSLGARLTPLPFIASPFMLPSVTPTGTNTKASLKAEIPPRSLSVPLLPRASHPRKYSLGTCSQPASPANLCSPNLGPQGRRVVSATATHTTHDGAHLRSGPRWLGAESCFGSKGPVPSQPLVAFWRLCWLLITAWVHSRSKLKTTLARLLTTGIISGAGLAVCHMLFFFQRNGRDKARQFQVVRTPGCGVQVSPSPGFRPEDSHPAHAPGLRPEANPPPPIPSDR